MLVILAWAMRPQFRYPKRAIKKSQTLAKILLEPSEEFSRDMFQAPTVEPASYILLTKVIMVPSECRITTHVYYFCSGGHIYHLSNNYRSSVHDDATHSPFIPTLLGLSNNSNFSKGWCFVRDIIHGQILIHGLHGT